MSSISGKWTDLENTPSSLCFSLGELKGFSTSKQMLSLLQDSTSNLAFLYYIPQKAQEPALGILMSFFGGDLSRHIWLLFHLFLLNKHQDGWALWQLEPSWLPLWAEI